MHIETDLIGYLAAAVGTLMMLPQLVKSVRHRRTQDLSWGFIAAYMVNCLLWEWYALRLGAMPMILCNGVALVIGAVQGGLKYRYDGPVR